jgi:hypothetical protein
MIKQFGILVAVLALAAGVAFVVAPGLFGQPSGEAPVVRPVGDDAPIQPLSNPDIDRFDIVQVLAAREGDVVGGRGERLMITNGIRHIIPMNQITRLLPPDRIPSIDNPIYISSSEADTWLADEEFVLGITRNGISRAYPLQILVWHEIVNDDFNGDPLLVTYCPLCFTGIAFEPFIDGEHVEFGTSGSLYNSDLVMYDRRTSSYWSQITGQSIVGELAGLTLEKVPIDTIRWGDWKRLHPDTEVLSRETGFRAPYGQEAYPGYYDRGGPNFPVAEDDSRLPAKAIVYGVFNDGLARAYPEQAVANAGGIVNDFLGDLNIVVVQEPGQISRPDGVIDSRAVSNRVTRIFDRELGGVILEFEILDGRLFDKQTGSEWSFEGVGLSGDNAGKKLVRLPSAAEFWFAWSSFYPGTQLFS